MVLYDGPCDECGERLVRNVRSGRKKLHIECAIARMERQHREWADRQSAAYRENQERGRRQAEQFSTQGGEWYENWREGMSRYIKREFTMKGNEPATVPGDKPAKGGSSTRRQRPDGRYQR